MNVPRQNDLIENAKYLGMFINFDISWDFHRQYFHGNTLLEKKVVTPLFEATKSIPIEF